MILLDPFPAEVVLQIVDQVDSVEALSRLSKCSRALHTLMIPILFLRDHQSGRYDAIRKGCQVEFTHLLQRAVDAGVIISYPVKGAQLLGEAIEHQNVDAVSLLISKLGVDANSTALDSMPLRLAIDKKNENIVKLLLAAGACPTGPRRGLQRNSLLHYCVNGYSAVSILDLLIDAGADTELANGHGLTPLQRAASLGRTEHVRHLLRHARGIHVTQTAFIAAQSGQVAVLELLLDELGLDIKQPTNVAGLINAAIESGSKNMVGFFLQRGLDINTQDSRTGRTLVAQAIFQGKLGVTDLLLSAGADLSIASRRGDLPIHLAAVESDERLLETLLKHRPELDTPDRNGEAPLTLAVRYQVNNAVRLIEAGANVNVRDALGVPIFILAVLSGDLSLYDKICSHGADVNLTNSKGQNALHCLISRLKLRSRHPRQGSALLMVQDLVKREVSVQIKDVYGMSPLMYAAQVGRQDIADCLIEAGACVNEDDFEEQPPLGSG